MKPKVYVNAQLLLVILLVNTQKTNPVFDAENYAPRTIGATIPTVGLRDAGDIPTMLGFARFASGAVPLSVLEDNFFNKLEQRLDSCQKLFIWNTRE